MKDGYFLILSLDIIKLFPTFVSENKKNKKQWKRRTSTTPIRTRRVRGMNTGQRALMNITVPPVTLVTKQHNKNR